MKRAVKNWWRKIIRTAACWGSVRQKRFIRWLHDMLTCWVKTFIIIAHDLLLRLKTKTRVYSDGEEDFFSGIVLRQMKLIGFLWVTSNWATVTYFLVLYSIIFLDVGSSAKTRRIWKGKFFVRLSSKIHVRGGAFTKGSGKHFFVWFIWTCRRL